MEIVEIERLNSILNLQMELFREGEIEDKGQLPLNRDVLGLLYYYKSKKSYHVKFEKCFAEVIKEICEIWKQTLIPIITYPAIKDKISKLLKRYQDSKRAIRKNIGCAIDLKYLDDVFYIAKCKCSQSKVTCACAPQNKIPEAVEEFLLDQMSARKFTANLLHDESDPLISDITSEAPTNVESVPLLTNQQQCQRNIIFNNNNDDDVLKDPDFLPNYLKIVPYNLKLPTSVNNLNLAPVAMEACRYNVSFKAAASIISRAFECINVITPEKKGLVVDSSKMRREQKKAQKNVVQKWAAKIKESKMQCFFFDGKKDNNREWIKKGDCLVQDNSMSFDNITLVQQPGDIYMGFATVAKSEAVCIFNAIKEHFSENEINLSNVCAIGCDGAPTNTGSTGGVIQFFESLLNRPIHWIICLIHLLDLLMKAVLKQIGELTKGPSEYAGSIGRHLNTCHTLPIVSFKKVKLENMPDMSGTFKLTSDQKDLYEFSKAVDSGVFPEKLEILKLGPLSGARWFTTALRILRLYVSVKNPSKNLEEIVRFIQIVYVPCLFWIKRYPSWIQGPRHLFRMLSFARNLRSDIFIAIRNKISNNSYFAHSENVLLSMIVDEDEIIRREGYQKIINIRKGSTEYYLLGDVRVFKTPKLQFINDISSNHYSQMIDWDNQNIYEPPYTQNLSLDQLEMYKESQAILDVPNLPCHSQATEFCVQLVSDAVKRVVGHESQDACVKTKLSARRLMPVFGTKKDFVCFNNDN